MRARRKEGSGSTLYDQETITQGLLQSFDSLVLLLHGLLLPSLLMSLMLCDTLIFSFYKPPSGLTPRRVTGRLKIQRRCRGMRNSGRSCLSAKRRREERKTVVFCRKRRRIAEKSRCDLFDALPDDLVLFILSKLAAAARRPSDFVHVQMTSVI